ncbi:hypothetical protein LJC09_01140 [Desulfovibrio sp. OttesenSCG-928-F20]|nr:hypothetical protein [Desulfovibrio sp. OttesenSCG-928-F20]
MCSVDKLNQNVTGPGPAPQSNYDPLVKDGSGDSTSGDMGGVVLLRPEFQTINTDTELQQALDRLENKSPETQRIISENLSHLSFLNQGKNSIGQQGLMDTLNGLLKDILEGGASGSSVPFANLYEALGGLLKSAAGQGANNPLLQSVLGVGNKLLDLLQSPDGIEKNSAEINKLLGELAKLASQLGSDGANENTQFAAALAALLHTALSVAFEVGGVKENYDELRKQINEKFPQLAVLAGAALASAQMTDKALLSMLSLICAMAMENSAKRIEQMESEFQVRDELAVKKKLTQKLLQQDEDRMSQLNVPSGSKLMSALSDFGDDGLDLINSMLLKHQVDSSKSGPV